MSRTVRKTFPERDLLVANDAILGPMGLSHLNVLTGPLVGAGISGPATHEGRVSPTFTPADPLFASQWHFDQQGDIETIWDTITGAGVHVGIYDDGVQYTHPDLDGNYDATRHIVIDGITYDGVNASGNDPHGTSVAGLIAAEAGNGIGGVGVAHGARITGVNIFDSTSDIYINAVDFAPFVRAIEAASGNFDVINNSWGSTPGFVSWQNQNVLGDFAAETIDAWRLISETGRDGLGTIVVKSSGNESRNSNGENGNSNRFTITVTATRDDGFPSSYSNHGADTLVAASAGDFASLGGLGIVTTDLLGTDGYNLRSSPFSSQDFTDDFGGTSSSGPLVTGIIALMLDANPHLGWRDVQEILSRGASHTGSALDAVSPGLHENGLWFFNGSGDWNGGGRHFSVNYGYGLANAYNSVRLAEAWSVFGGPARTSDNEAHISRTNDTGGALLDLSSTTIGVNAGKFNVEHIAVNVNFVHPNFTSDLRIFLVSPDGTEVMLADGTAGNNATADSGLNWTFGVDSFRGVNAQGNWTVRFDDISGGGAGTWTNVTLDFFGSKYSANNIHSVTDEFSDIVGLDPSRALILDGNGGKDWLDLSMLSDPATVNLGTRAGFFGNSTVTLGGLENVYGTAGDDILIGNKGNNTLVGGMGDDDLRGGKGDDNFLFNISTVTGAFQTDQVLDYGKGNDVLDVSEIDANANTAKNDKFKFIGNNDLTGTPGQLHFQFDKPNKTTFVAGDFNGDGIIDFLVVINGVHKLEKGDFNL